MQFDPENHVIKLCALGMEFEGEGKKDDALKLFKQAWNESATDLEKFTAAHYVARHQENVANKLKWDETALNLALKINDENVKGAYPSLYLNIAKCYEDLLQFDKAIEHYNRANSFVTFLNNDGYGEMIKAGIANGIKRVKK